MLRFKAAPYGPEEEWTFEPQYMVLDPKNRFVYGIFRNYHGAITYCTAANKNVGKDWLEVWRILE